MRRFITIIAVYVMATVVAMAATTPAAVASSPRPKINHVEPLSWWVGMNTPLQLMVNGPEVSECTVAIYPEGHGVELGEIHRADSPNYLFIDVTVAPDATPGDYVLRFTRGRRTVEYTYTIAAREEGSRERSSFTTADFVYLIMPD